MILAYVPQNGNCIAVKILDVFNGGSGRKIAAVEAVEGQPFTAWTHGGPAYSKTAQVPAAFLQNVHVEPEGNGSDPAPVSLLDLALAQAKASWYSGETIILFKKMVWICNESGFIRMRIRGYRKPLTIFWLDMAAGEWKVSRDTQDYPAWVDEYRLTNQSGNPAK